MWWENFKNNLIIWLIRRTHIYTSTVYFMLFSIPRHAIPVVAQQVLENTDEELANYYRPIRFLKHPEWRHKEP